MVYAYWFGMLVLFLGSLYADWVGAISGLLVLLLAALADGIQHIMKQLYAMGDDLRKIRDNLKK